MFALVADVERYPEFVPLCDSLRVVSRHQEGERETVTAAMTVAYRLLHETFTSRVVLEPAASRIQVNYIDGPFRYLENIWTFQPTSEAACEVGFTLSYAFKSRMLQALMGAVFDSAFRKFADAFEARADAVYGRGTVSRPVA